MRERMRSLLDCAGVRRCRWARGYNHGMKALLASPRGFCAGVDRAIEVVDQALDAFGPPIYVRHEIVHNEHVVDALRRKGAIFTDDLADVPEGSVLIF